MCSSKLIIPLVAVAAIVAAPAVIGALGVGGAAAAGSAGTAIGAGVLPTAGGLTNVAAAAGTGFSFSGAAPWLSLGLQGLGGISNMLGQQQMAAAYKAQQEYAAAVDRNNAIIANQYAADALSRGEQAFYTHRSEVGRIIGAQVADLASRGVVVNQDSALQTVTDTAEVGALEGENIKTNAAREAQGFRTQGVNFAQSAMLAQMRADAPVNFFGTALTTASSLASRYVDYRQKGLV